MWFSNSIIPDHIGTVVSSTLLTAWRLVPDLSPAQWMQIFYVVATGLVLGVAILPKRPRASLLTYGARADKAPKQVVNSVAGQGGSDGQYRDEPDRDQSERDEAQNRDDTQNRDEAQNTEPVQDGGPDAQDRAEGQEGLDDGNTEIVNDSSSGQDDWFAKFVAIVTSWGQIPHSWFGGFYVVSMACSVFWLVQYLTDGRILHFLATRQAAASASGMEPGQVTLLWSMMFLQGLRRWIESTWLFQPGKKSTMWIVHWLLGNVYYIAMSLSIWIEGPGNMPWLSSSLSPVQTADQNVQKRSFSAGCLLTRPG